MRGLDSTADERRQVPENMAGDDAKPYHILTQRRIRPPHATAEAATTHNHANHLLSGSAIRAVRLHTIDGLNRKR
jgi:hypothetical protein